MASTILSQPGVAHPSAIVGAKAFYWSNALGYDPDAAAYIDAAGLTDPEQKEDANTLIVSLKDFGLWSNIHGFWPELGGTATSHAVNAKTATSGTFHGAVTHDANGITGDGATGYFDTGIPQSLVGATGGYCFYKRTSGTGDNKSPMGVSETSDNNRFYFTNNYDFGQKYGSFGDNELAVEAGAPGQGLWAINRSGSTNIQLYLNGVSLVTNTNSTPFSNIAFNFYLLAQNDAGSAAGFDATNLAFAAIFDSFSPSFMADLNTIVQAFQTARGRNV